LNALINIISVINSRCVGHAELMRKVSSAYKILARKSEGLRSLGRPRCRLKYNIIAYLQETEQPEDMP
jgi:hypothetical protein